MIKGKKAKKIVKKLMKVDEYIDETFLFPLEHWKVKKKWS